MIAATLMVITRREVMICDIYSDSRSEEMYECVPMSSLGFCCLVQLDVIDCGLDIL
jgi:hypothetical protein